MEKYKYIDWASYVYKKYWLNKERTSYNANNYFFQEVRSFKSKQVIEHLSGQYRQASEDGHAFENDEIEYLFSELKTCLDSVSSAIEQGNVEKVFTSAFRLGILDGDLKLPLTERIELQKGLNNDIKRRLPIIKHNQAKKLTIDVVQDIAEELWRRDKQQKIRIGDMCELVWSYIIKDSSKLAESLIDINGKSTLFYLPDNAQGLKSWIREIAPDYARRGGRPSKNKK